MTVNFFPGFTWIAGIPAPVLSLVLCRVRGSTTLGRSGNFPRCPADTSGYGIIQLQSQRNIGREGEVNNRHAGVLAHRNPEPLGDFDILQDIGKLPAGYRVRLGSGCLFNNPQNIRREADDGALVRFEGGIGKR